jgi:tyrosyl-tRNA synthetase
MWRWFELLSFEVSLAELARMKSDAAAGQLHPREAKLRLARELAARFHGAAEAEAAIQGWQAAVRGEADKNLLEIKVLAVPAEGARLAAVLRLAGLAGSNTEANRKIQERAVRIDNQIVEDSQLLLMPGFEGVLQVGKRNFTRVQLQSEA